jgi:hypothetical protein
MNEFDKKYAGWKGHVDIDITMKYYIFNRKGNDELISIL